MSLFLFIYTVGFFVHIIVAVREAELMRHATIHSVIGLMVLTILWPVTFVRMALRGYVSYLDPE